ncbi:MAG TPA: MFS transporter [Rhizomicrobium sp.]|jgi:PAT family beta-lactamase induction signal transducer AmpG|nr:MFS transporter [Rhizomicrobium sp.]
MSALSRSRDVLFVYFRPRIALMLTLGFSSGLPFLLIFGTLSAWLREAGISRTEIGLMSYVGLAYTIKFLWAPLVDQIRLPILARLFGKRRAWMLLAQAAIAGALVTISLFDPRVALMPIAIGAVVLAFAAATQDIAIDAWRIEAAPKSEQGTMAAAYQLGYRFAIIASGAGALYVAQYVSWHVAYLAMAALMLLGVGAVLLAPRVESDNVASTGMSDADRQTSDGHQRSAIGAAFAWLYHAAVAPFIDFFSRHGWTALLILALIGFYRVPDFVMGVMANPLYIDLGFSLAQIATVVKLFGVWMTIAGAIVGGIAVARFGLMRSLIIGVCAVAAGNLIFSWLATQGNDITALTVAISSENFAGGFAGTALIAYMSSLTSTAFTATQYALFSSIYALPGKLLGGLSGMMVDWFSVHPAIATAIAGAGTVAAQTKTAGYVPFFVVTAAMALVPLVLIFIVMRREGHENPDMDGA